MRVEIRVYRSILMYNLIEVYYNYQRTTKEARIMLIAM